MHENKILSSLLVKYVHYLNTLMYLVLLQVHAWELADHLLVLKKDLPTSMFAAQTMRAKIQFSFDELPEPTHVVSNSNLLWFYINSYLNRLYETHCLII